MTKKTTKDVKVIELIERIGELYLCDEPTNEDIANIVSALGDRNYQTEFPGHFQRWKWQRRKEGAIEYQFAHICHSSLGDLRPAGPCGCRALPESYLFSLRQKRAISNGDCRNPDTCFQ